VNRFKAREIDTRALSWASWPRPIEWVVILWSLCGQASEFQRWVRGLAAWLTAQSTGMTSSDWGRASQRELTINSHR